MVTKEVTILFGERRDLLLKTGIFFKCIYLFIYFWLCWAFTATEAFSLAVAREGCPSAAQAVPCGSLSCWRAWALWYVGSTSCGPRTEPLCGPVGDLPGSRIKPVSPDWQADSVPPSHQGSPLFSFLKKII